MLIGHMISIVCAHLLTLFFSFTTYSVVPNFFFFFCFELCIFIVFVCAPQLYGANDAKNQFDAINLCFLFFHHSHTHRHAYASISLKFIVTRTLQRNLFPTTFTTFIGQFSDANASPKSHLTFSRNFSFVVVVGP